MTDIAENTMNFSITDDEARLEAKNRFDGNLVFGNAKFHQGTKRSGGKTGARGPADGKMHKEQALVVEDTGDERYRRIEEHWEPVKNCPVCNSSERTFSLSRYGLDIYACDECTHQYMDPRITFDKLTTLYAADKTAEVIYKSEMQQSIDREKSAYGLALIDNFDKSGRHKIMDLGCGSGLFLKVAHEQGWRSCVGIDANSGFSDCYQSSEGLQYINSTFEAIDPAALGGDYNAITMWNVLEHLYDLDAIITSLRNMLAKDGVLFIMVPNVHSLATRVIRERSATFNWKHVSHFSPKSLPRLMEDRGLETVHLETAISEIDNVKSYLSGAWPYSSFGDPDGHFDFITPKFIHDRLLGSRLIGIFRK